MLNKKESAALQTVVQLLQQLISGGAIDTGIITSSAEVLKKVSATADPLAGLNKNSRALYKMLSDKYGERVITVTDNEFLRKAQFDCRLSGLFPWVKALEKRGLCIYETDPKFSRPRLVSFILKSKIK